MAEHFDPQVPQPTTRARAIHDAYAAKDGNRYGHKKHMVNSTASFIQHSDAINADPVQKFVALIQLIAEPVKPQTCDVDATAVITNIADVMEDRTRMAQVVTTDQIVEVVLKKHIENRARKDRDHGEVVAWTSSDIDRVFAKRLKQMIKDVFYYARERHHCEPAALKPGRRAPQPRNHVEYIDEDPKFIAKACEKALEILWDMNMYDMTDLTAPMQWPLQEIYADRLDTVLERYYARVVADKPKLDIPSNPCDIFDFIIAGLHGLEWGGKNLYEARDLSSQEDKQTKKIMKDHLGQKSYVVGLHFQDDFWFVTVHDEKTGKVEAKAYDVGVHVRGVIGPCIADNLAKTESVWKTRQYIELYRDSKITPRRARVAKARAMAAVPTPVAAVGSLFVTEQ